MKCRIDVCMTEGMYLAVERLSKDHAIGLPEVVRRLVALQLHATKTPAEIDTPYLPAQNRLTRSIH